MKKILTTATIIFLTLLASAPAYAGWLKDFFTPKENEATAEPYQSEQTRKRDAEYREIQKKNREAESVEASNKIETENKTYVDQQMVEWEATMKSSGLEVNETERDYKRTQVKQTIETRRKLGLF